MSRIYALSRPQRNVSCRLNSAFVGVYLMEHPELIETIPYEPKLLMFLQKLAQVETLLVMATLDLDIPEITKIQATLSERHWLNEKSIATLNQIIEDNAALRETLGLTEDKKDPLGLEAAYQALKHEVLEVPVLSKIGEFIAACEKYYENEFMKDKQNAYGLQCRDAISAVASETLKESLQETNEIKFGSPKTYLQSEINTALKTVFDDSRPEQLIQLTTGGHTTIFGKRANQYWQFDSIGNVTQDRLVCATLSIYDNQAEALAAMKERAKKGACELVEISTTPRPEPQSGNTRKQKI